MPGICIRNRFSGLRIRTFGICVLTAVRTVKLSCKRRKIHNRCVEVIYRIVISAHYGIRNNALKLADRFIENVPFIISARSIDNPLAVFILGILILTVVIGNITKSQGINYILIFLILRNPAIHIRKLVGKILGYLLSVTEYGKGIIGLEAFCRPLRTNSLHLFLCEPGLAVKQIVSVAGFIGYIGVHRGGVYIIVAKKTFGSIINAHVIRCDLILISCRRKYRNVLELALEI